MPTAISPGTSATASAAYGSGALSSTSLQAQLERFQKQLSDCVNCASAKTPQGKSDIQAISARISQIEQRIAQAEKSPGKQDSGNAGTPAPVTAPSSAYGATIDVYA